MGLRPGFTASRLALELDGIETGLVRSAVGGEPFGVVVREEPANGRVGKHIGSVRYQPIVLEVPAPLSPPLAERVAAMLDGTDPVSAGALVTLDGAMKVRSRLEWSSARITEVGFPAADGASRDAAVVRLVVEPEQTVLKDGSGATYKTVATRQKTVLVSNFRFELSGLEAAGTKVSKVSALTATRRRGDEIGRIRPASNSATALEVADVTFWISRSDVAPYAGWFEDFVLAGTNGDAAERTGSLTFLDPSLQTELLRIDLEGVGIVRVANEPVPPSGDAIARSRVELYCEALRLAKLS